MPTFGTLVLWVHLVAVVIWVGGLAVVWLACVPVVTSAVRPPQDAARLAGMVVHRFQRISWEVMSLILVTGIIKLIEIGAARGFELGASYVGMLVAKVGLFATIAAIQVWQSFRLVPAFAASAPADSASPETERFKRRALVSAVISFVLAASAILLGLQLGHH